MKQLSMTLALFLIAVATAGAQDKKPASPAETAKGTINGSEITIHYSSPSVKGREIWGGLVPLEQVWRAGANEATTFETTKDLWVEGKKLPAGTYSFFVLPHKGDAEIVFNKVAKQWGAYKYDEKQDELRVKVPLKMEKQKRERLVYTVNPNGFELAWDDWSLPVSAK